MHGRFTSYQKLTLWIFIVVGSATFVFGVLNFRKSSILPFARRPSANGFQTAEELERERTQKLKTQDTDADTLTDYDELFVFRTSPFLEDSDSDGDADGKEVAAASDPNCPKGKTCRQVRAEGVAGVNAPAAGGGAVESGAAPTATLPDGDTIVQVITETFGDIGALTPASISAKLSAMSSAQLKGFLVKLGVPEAALAKADDATLRALLQESLTEIAGAADEAIVEDTSAAGQTQEAAQTQPEEGESEAP